MSVDAPADRLEPVNGAVAPSIHDELDLEEEEDDSHGTAMFGDLDADSQEQQVAKQKLLLANFDDEQMARYEAFRRANINRGAVKKFANSILNQSITANVSVALSGMSKVLVGDIVERARDVQSKMEGPPEDGFHPAPLKPEHLREAWRQYKLETGSVPGTKWRRLGDGGHLFR